MPPQYVNFSKVFDNYPLTVLRLCASLESRYGDNMLHYTMTKETSYGLLKLDSITR